MRPSLSKLPDSYRKCLLKGIKARVYKFSRYELSWKLISRIKKFTNCISKIHLYGKWITVTCTNAAGFLKLVANFTGRGENVWESYGCESCLLLSSNLNYLNIFCSPVFPHRTCYSNKVETRNFVHAKICIRVVFYIRVISICEFGKHFDLRFQICTKVFICLKFFAKNIAPLSQKTVTFPI